MPTEASRKSVPRPESDSFNLSPAQRQMTKNAGRAAEFRDWNVTKFTKDGPQTETVSARDESEAWAVFCDLLKSWPSRHAVEATVVAA